MKTQTDTIWAMRLQKTDDIDLNDLLTVTIPNQGLIVFSAGDMDIPLAFPNVFQAMFYLHDVYGVPTDISMSCVKPFNTACDTDSIECVAIPEPMAIKCPHCGKIVAHKTTQDNVLACPDCGTPLALTRKNAR